jgi:ABC-type uncharacterized transport system permease subunit
MLVGAFLAVYGAVITGSAWGGLVLALFGGAVLGAIHAYFVVRLAVDQIVTGIALSIFCLGLSGYLFRLTVGKSYVAVPAFASVDLSPLDKLPLIGPALFDQQPPVYLGVLLACVSGLILNYTRLGLEIRAVGESPESLEAAGVSVFARRFLATTYGGALAGLGGATLAIAELDSFVENMVSGRGFIAIACVVFGRWRPLGALIAAFAFGLTEALQIRLQFWLPGVPYQAFVVIPYLVAVGALVLLGRGTAMPKALGQPYRGTSG